MLTVFQVCFFTGIGLIILSFILGNLLEFFGIDGLDLDFDFLGTDLYIPISPVLFLLFSTVFGGIGWIILLTVPDILPVFTIIISIIAGFVVSLMVDRLVIRPLKKAQNTSAPDTEELIGVRAVISEAIAENGFGEIRYVVNGNSYTAPAKSTDGSYIESGKDVAICWIKDYVFYVIRIAEANDKKPEHLS